MLPEIDLGFASIPLYGTLFMIGFVISVFFVAYLAAHKGIAGKTIAMAGLFGIIGIVIGAKLVYFLTVLPRIVANSVYYMEMLKSDPVSFFEMAFGGMVFYGGLIGFCIGVYLYCRKFGLDFLGLSDLFTPFLPFGHAFGRLGCFCAGCCYGVEYHGLLSVHFPYNEEVPELSEVPRLPIQLIEAGLNFICFGALFYILLKHLKQSGSSETGNWKKGRLLGIYLLYYIIVRFVLEFFRGDAIRGSIGFLSTSQIISILLIPVVFVLIKKQRFKNP